MQSAWRSAVTLRPMLDPRIYRTSLLAVAVAVIVLAFSLTNQHGAARSTLAPDAFNGQNAYATMNKLATTFPNRRAGSSHTPLAA